MAWETPKTDWIAADNPGPNDFNRIEKNTEINRLLIQYIPGITGWGGEETSYIDVASFAVQLPSDIVTARVFAKIIVENGQARLRFGTTYAVVNRFGEYIIDITGSETATIYIQTAASGTEDVWAYLDPMVHVIIL